MMEKDFKKLVQFAGVEEPSQDFTGKVMGMINTEQAVSTQVRFIFKPIISKAAWAFIGLFFLLIIVLLSVMPYSSGQASYVGEVLNKYTFTITPHIGHFTKSPLIPLLTLCAGLLLCLELLFSGKIRFKH